MDYIQPEDTQALMAELFPMNQVLADEKLERWRQSEIAIWNVVNIAMPDKSLRRKRQKVRALMKVLDPAYAEYLRSGVI